jgi:hypothetical protein
MSSHKASAAPSVRPKRAPRGEGKQSAAEPTASHVAAGPAGATDDLSGEAARLAAAIEQALAQGQPDRIGREALQSLMAAVCRAYRAQIDAGANYLPLPERTAVAPTDVMVACGALLKAADLQVFELGMWQSFTGR